MPRIILVVEDNADDLTVLSSFLGEDYTIIAAENIFEMVSALRENSKLLSAVLIALNMLESDGVEALTRVHESALYRQIPVISMSNGNEDKNITTALAMGASGNIAKPFNKKMLTYTLKNIIELREKAALANTFRNDILTGIPNRTFFFEMADSLIRRNKPGYYVLSCFDVENFKVINEQYGTKVGDDILKHIAQTIDNGVKKLGGVCCRYSADRFGMLYPAQHVDSDIIRELHKKATAPTFTGQKLKIRIGRYSIVDKDIPINAMYDRATLAEESIRGRYDTFLAEYNDSMLDSLLNEQGIVNDMYAALADGEFEPWFQPQYNHATGALIGAEALVRWAKNGKFIVPKEFISVFERNGFIYEMDRYIWEQVCIFLRSLIDNGKSPLPVSINISRCDLFHDDFIEVITDLIKKYNIPIGLLRLEVTESAFAETSGQIIAKVSELINLGYTIEIDDFGSGYSSLNTLKDVSASILKLDMRFFENTKNHQRSGNIVESIVRMAKWLGMAVIAEGVDDIEQADYLKSIGCYYIQGYLYSKALCADDFKKLFEKSNKEPELNRLRTLKTLDNNEFWNPKSMETLIFNSYVGGACIFEFFNDKSELLRVNEQYFNEFGSLVSSEIQFKESTMIRFLDKENYKIMLNTVHKSIKNEKEASCELRLTDSINTEFLRVTVRPIARTVDHYLIYCVIINTSQQHIAEQKRLEAELKQAESARQLGIIMNNINGGVSAIQINDDGSSNFVFNNERYYELYGYTRNQAIKEKLDVMDTIVREDFTDVMEKVRKIKTTGEPAIIDYRCIKRDGRLAYLRANASLMYIEGFGDVITSVVTDITEQRELNDKFEALIENINGGVSAIYLKKNKPEYVVVNEKYYEIIGYTKEQFEAEVKDIFDLVHPDDRKEVKRKFMNAAQSKEQYSMEYRFIRRDGEVRNILCNTNVINLFGVDEPVQLAVSTDITEWRKAEQNEKSISMQKQTILSNLCDGIIVSAMDSDDNMSVIYANERFYEMYGYTEEQYNSEISNVIDIVHPDDRKKAVDIARRVLCENDSATFEVRCVKRDKSIMWQQVRNSVIVQENSDEPALLTVLNDITAQKVLQEKQKEMLDNLPYGVALFEYDKNHLSVVHINKHYWELVEREPYDYAETYILDSVHKEDIKLVEKEIESAIRQKRNIDVDLRILCGKTGYKAFHATSNISTVDGKYLLYTSFKPISEQEMSIQSMFQVALSTLMSASDDFSYVKDIEQRYICCSQSFADVLGFENSKDIIGKTDYELFESSFAKRFIARGNRIIKYNEVLKGLVENVPGNNSKQYLVSTSLYPIMGTTGSVIGIYGTGRDITEQQEQESQLKLLTSTIPGGIAAYSISEIVGIKLLYFNDGYFNFTGYSREEYTAITDKDPLALVFDEDKQMLSGILGEFKKSKKKGYTNGCIIRCHTKSGGFRWMNVKATVSKPQNSLYIINVVQFDITEQQEEKEKLRISEEFNRLAIEQVGSIITQFDVNSRTLTIPVLLNPIFDIPHVLYNMPEEQIALGRVSPDTADSYTKLFKSIMKGKKSGKTTFKQNSKKGWRWLEAQYTTVFSNDGKPVSAVISFTDVTDKLEKEIVYQKWQQSLNERPKDSYALFRCNLSKNASFDSWEGNLLNVNFKDGTKTFDERTAEYAQQCVFSEDIPDFIAFLSSDTLLLKYYRGHRYNMLEYREVSSNGSLRWLQLSVDLVEYPGSNDIEAYLMFENIDEKKRADLLTLELSEKDSLTGAYNRTAFISRTEEIIKSSGPDDMHALFMLDIDNFKHVNDTYGHNVGDLVLRCFTEKIKSVLRRDDIIGRPGGDEFFIFMKNIPNKKVVCDKAGRLCSCEIQIPSSSIEVTASIGIAIIPENGTDFNLLYEKSDKALYQQKKNGKNGFFLVCD